MDVAAVNILLLGRGGDVDLNKDGGNKHLRIRFYIFDEQAAVVQREKDFFAAGVVGRLAESVVAVGHLNQQRQAFAFFT